MSKEISKEEMLSDFIAACKQAGMVINDDVYIHEILCK